MNKAVIKILQGISFTNHARWANYTSFCCKFPTV